MILHHLLSRSQIIMNLSEKTKRDAFDILKRCEDKEITAGKHPVAQAAASLYMWLVL